MVEAQTYSFYPNPKNGIIVLEQTIADKQPVSIEVMDAIGKSVLKKTLVFTGKQANLNLAVVDHGLYLLKIADGAGNNFKFKFTVIK